MLYHLIQGMYNIKHITGNLFCPSFLSNDLCSIAPYTWFTYFLPPTPSAFAQTTPLFEISLHFDLNYTPEKFFWHGCDVVDSKNLSADGHINTWQSTQNCFSGSSFYSRCLQDHILQWSHAHAHNLLLFQQFIAHLNKLSLIYFNYSLSLVEWSCLYLYLYLFDWSRCFVISGYWKWLTSWIFFYD